jgi:hypothetical protein
MKGQFGMRRLTTANLMDRLGIRSRETLRQRTKKTPGFPKPIHDPGSTINYYLEQEVNEYLQRLAEARDSKSRDQQPAQLAAP